MGDFNLRGVAAGPSAGPAAGSGHEAISQEFLRMLTLADLRPLPKPATHRRGGGLDLHITN